MLSAFLSRSRRIVRRAALAPQRRRWRLKLRCLLRSQPRLPLMWRSAFAFCGGFARMRRCSPPWSPCLLFLAVFAANAASLAALAALLALVAAVFAVLAAVVALLAALLRRNRRNVCVHYRRLATVDEVLNGIVPVLRGLLPVKSVVGYRARSAPLSRCFRPSLR